MPQTRSQRLAQSAYSRVGDAQARNNNKLPKEYVSFAKKFPALIHTCGLAQAVAFARAKKGLQEKYVGDLAEVLRTGGYHELTSAEALAGQTCQQQLSGYLRLSRDAIEAAVWLKRYVEAMAPDESEEED